MALPLVIRHYPPVKFVLLLAAMGVAGWALARWASAGGEPADESFGAAYNRESTQMSGVMAVLAVVVGIPVALAGVSENAAVPIVIGVAALVVGFFVVDRLGRRFPSLKLPTGDGWRDDLRAQFAPRGVRLAFAFIALCGVGVIIVSRL